MKRKVAFYTLGCKVNQYEAEALKEKFRRAGYEVFDAGKEKTGGEADVYIINTCTVTNLADRKSRQFIRRAAKENPEALVVATGCYVQIKPEEASEIEGVDLVVGTNEKSGILEMVERRLREKERDGANEQKQLNAEDQNGEGTMDHGAGIARVLPYEELDEYRSDGIITAMEGKSRAFIKIEEGCNRFCSYCIIPYARGKVRSRDRNEILVEAKTLIDNGFRELVLTGINTALYGTGGSDTGIEPLIRDLNDLPGDFRIRLSSLEPTVIDADYVKRLLKYDRLCHHLHLSLQSGSDRILKAMNRKYTRGEFMKIVDVLRGFDSNYGITSDIIVGFPGEEETDFRDSMAMVKEVGFDRVHIFKYSKRRGTRAAEMPNQIPGKIMKKRAETLSDAASEVSLKRRKAMYGDSRMVLWEERGSDGQSTGYTDNYIRTYSSDGEILIGEFSQVKIGGVYLDGVEGT